MRELNYIDRLFKQKERLRKQRERIQGKNKEDNFEESEIILEEEPERKLTRDASEKWARRKAKWDLRQRKYL